jgi:hypothetical protein
MEESLSREILVMQRGIREKKRQEERNAKSTSSANSSFQKVEAATAESDVSAIKPTAPHHYSWERLSLSDIQLADLQAMDMTDLSTALLEHPRGTDVEYTERDRKVLRVLLERKVSRRQQKT